MRYPECAFEHDLELSKKRRLSTTEFYIEGEPQVYCYGVVSNAWDGDYCSECYRCRNFALGKQCEEDFEKALYAGKITRRKHARIH